MLLRPTHPCAPRPRRATAAAPRGVVGAVVLAAALLVTGCSTPVKNQQPVAATPTAPVEAAAPGLERFYDQALEWTACGDFECARATVPLDYADPAGATIELALQRARARGGEPIASLLINPGGPGVSGIEFLEPAVTDAISERVTERYDVVGFDPRGVGESSAVRCLDDEAKDALLSTDLDQSSDAGLQEALAVYGEFARACAANTGPLLAHVDTVSAARDLDVLRAALGDESLHYLGYSYGTKLGATYAGLFPERAGRLVLDGAVDPSLSYEQMNLDQAAGFESALRAYVRDCQAGGECPLTGTLEEGLAQISGLVERAARTPLPTQSGRRVTGRLATTGIVYPLYDNELWSVLTQGLTAALREGDGTVLLAIADAYNRRNEDGTFADNSQEAFRAINCLDDAPTADVQSMRAEADRLAEVAPTLGSDWAYGGVICAQWPHPRTGVAAPITAEGAPPIVVIGTTNDPATPYAWSESLADQLSSGVLLTYEGEGHTAYGRSNDCIAEAVDTFLLEGTPPEDGTRC